MNEVLEKATKDAMSHGKLLLVAKAGSNLYGTHTESSDEDYIALYKPNIERILVNNYISSKRYGTKENIHEKNSAGDIDVSLFDIRSKINDFFRGEINAVDAIYAFTNPDAVLFVDPKFESFLRANFFPARIEYISFDAVFGYINSQVSKYGLKGTRLGEVYQLRDLLSKYDENTKIEEFIAKEEKELEKFSHVFVTEVEVLGPGGVAVRPKSLDILGKRVPGNARVKQALDVVGKLIKKYGERAEKARKAEGIDWKAVSHAFRAMYMYRKLLNDGYFEFPIDEDYREFLKRLKLGNADWEKVSKQLEDELAELKEIEKNRKKLDKSRRKEIVDMLVLRLYEGDICT